MIDVAISSWSLHTLFLNPDLTGLRAADFPSIARRYFGVRHIEYFEGDYAPGLADKGFDDDRHAETIRHASESAGVSVVCLAAINDLTDEDEAHRDRDRERILRLARHCEILGCPVIRVNSGRRRLDRRLADRLVDEMRRLSDALADRPVRLAIENHPHVLDSDVATGLLLGVVEEIDRENVRLCPDVGAIGPGYWRTGFERLARRAAHVHLKPFVLEAPGVQLGVPVYAPRVRDILTGYGYSGSVSLEYLPSLDLLTPDLCRECRSVLHELTAVFGYPAAPDPTCDEGLYRPGKSTLQMSADRALTPSSGILQLLADGCELRLGARVEIHDFAQGVDVKSRGADHRTLGIPEGVGPGAGESPAELSEFCKVAKDDPLGSAECRRFHDSKLALIREGAQVQPRVCICPMGLILLSVPITDKGNAYGLISSGPWVERGTEGMIVDGIIRLTSPASHRKLEDASLRIDAFAPSKLAEAAGLLGDLATDLGGLYKERELTNRYLTQGPLVIDQLREKTYSSGQIEFDQFVARIGSTFDRFESVVRFGRLALYRHRKHESGSETLDLLLPSPGPDDLPAAVIVPPSDRGNRTPDARMELKRAVEDATGQSCLVSERREADELVVFVFPPGVTIANHPAKILFEQFSSEVHHILASLRNLTELAIFIDRFKHAISSPLQGISDRILQLRAGLQGKRTMPFSRLRELGDDLRDFSNEAGSILDRFTGRVRLLGSRSLRPQLNFSRMNPIKVIEESVRKLSRNAARRQIRIRPPAQVTPPPFIEGDPEALAEVFDNLIENALKFARDGSLVTIQTAASGDLEDTTLPWKLERPGRRFIISDFGLGIFPEDLSRIFQPYVQGRAFSPNRVIRGTGLGLAICRQIVEAHGGSIVATSRALHGTEKLPYPENLQDCIVEVYVDLPLQVPRADHGKRTGAD